MMVTYGKALLLQAAYLGLFAAIGLGVAALIETFKNWDKAGTNFLQRWIDKTFPALGKGIDWLFDKLIGLLGKIKDAWQWMKDLIGLGGDEFELTERGRQSESMGTLPGYASGGLMQKSGWAMVGERGPELVKMPGGARVFSNAASQKMAGGVTNNFSIASLVVREQADVDLIARRLYDMQRNALLARGV